MTRQLEITQPFNLKLSLTMGQAFRWRPFGDGWFSGVVGPHLIHLRQTDGGIEYETASRPGHEDDPDECLRRYFRLDDDIDAIYSRIACDPKVATIMREYPGLRILRQDPWECLTSQLCATRTDDVSAGEAVESIAKFLGAELQLEGDVRYTFPTPRELESDYRLAHIVWKWQLGSEFAWNIGAITQRVDKGEVNWDELRRQPYPKTRQSLMQFAGSSGKTADRIALFALDQLESFPLDKWVWRAITEAYPEWGFPEKPEPNAREGYELLKEAHCEFGEYAGYANQYLYYWRRRHGEERLSFGARWRGKFRITPPEGRQLDDEYLDELRYEYLKAKYLSC